MYGRLKEGEQGKKGGKERRITNEEEGRRDRVEELRKGSEEENM